MTSLAELYPAHLEEMQRRTRTIVEQQGLDGLVIHSGQLQRIFLDDNDYPFKVNPHFKAWLPVTDNPNCWLIVDGTHRPKLVFYRPEDFWFKVPPAPADYWTDFFDISLLDKAEQVGQLLPRDMSNYGYIGEHVEVCQALGIGHFNAEPVINYLHYHRAYKTDYEIECMRRANRLAVAGHNAARDAFFAGATEFEAHLAYLAATGHTENELPYGNIIAYNENGATLHYMVQQRSNPDPVRSLLIDAGASFNGYAADITRSYCKNKDSEFAGLIAGMDTIQQQLGQSLAVGVRYPDIHMQWHLQTARLLTEFDVIRTTPEAAVENGISSVFCPHGIGHFLGLQVHDVGGHVADEAGTPLPPPEGHPALRVTRTVEARQVFTIEPGVYFIDSLLARLKQSAHASAINWDKVDTLRPYGGIRIEDNIVVYDDHLENLTRDLDLV